MAPVTSPVGVGGYSPKAFCVLALHHAKQGQRTDGTGGLPEGRQLDVGWRNDAKFFLEGLLEPRKKERLLVGNAAAEDHEWHRLRSNDVTHADPHPTQHLAPLLGGEVFCRRTEPVSKTTPTAVGLEATKLSAPAP